MMGSEVSYGMGNTEKQNRVSNNDEHSRKLAQRYIRRLTRNMLRRQECMVLSSEREICKGYDLWEM